MEPKASPPQRDRADRILRGDLVSWQPDGEKRHYARMVRRTTRDYKPAFVVRDSRNQLHIIPTAMITKEVG